MLDLRRQAQDAINELERNPRGELVIAANEATCIYVLPQRLLRIQEPVSGRATCRWTAPTARAWWMRVMDNIADFGLTQLPVEEKRLQVVNIYQDEIRLIVPARHPLAERKPSRRRTWSMFHCCCPSPGTTRTRLNAWLELVEDDLHVSMELDSTEMIKRFVMAGLGVSFLAVSNCREEVAAGELRAVSLAPEPMVRRLGLIYRKDKALSKAALGFIQVVLDNLGDGVVPRQASEGNGWIKMICSQCGKSIETARRPQLPALRSFPPDFQVGRPEKLHHPDLGRRNRCRLSLG